MPPSRRPSYTCEMTEQATLKREFDRFDADKNGFIDRDEFAALVKSLGVELSEDKVGVAFRALDVNGNDRIEFNEFRVWWASL